MEVEAFGTESPGKLRDRSRHVSKEAWDLGHGVLRSKSPLSCRTCVGGSHRNRLESY